MLQVQYLIGNYERQPNRNPIMLDLANSCSAATPDMRSWRNHNGLERSSLQHDCDEFFQPMLGLLLYRPCNLRLVNKSDQPLLDVQYWLRLPLNYKKHRHTK